MKATSIFVAFLASQLIHADCRSSHNRYLSAMKVVTKMNTSLDYHTRGFLSGNYTDSRPSEVCNPTVQNGGSEICEIDPNTGVPVSDSLGVSFHTFMNRCIDSLVDYALDGLATPWHTLNEFTSPTYDEYLATQDGTVTEGVSGLIFNRLSEGLFGDQHNHVVSRLFLIQLNGTDPGPSAALPLRDLITYSEKNEKAWKALPTMEIPRDTRTIIVNNLIYRFWQHDYVFAERGPHKSFLSVRKEIFRTVLAPDQPRDLRNILVRTIYYLTTREEFLLEY